MVHNKKIYHGYPYLIVTKDYTYLEIGLIYFSNIYLVNFSGNIVINIKTKFTLISSLYFSCVSNRNYIYYEHMGVIYDEKKMFYL